MIRLHKRIHLKPGKSCWIAPFNDIHLNTEECDKPRFLRYVKWGVNRLRDGDEIVGIGLGDYNDFLSPSERASIASAKGGYGLHETSLQQIDKWLKEITLNFARTMTPWKGYIVALLEGHHYMCYSGVSKARELRGLSSTEHLCQLLDATYAGQLLRLTLDFGDNCKLVVIATHGYGGARTPGARVIKRVRMNEVARGNLYLMAHDNTKMAISDNELDEDKDGNYIAHKRTYCGTGSFQRAYPDNEPHGGYVEQIMLPPSDLGATITQIRKEKRNGKWRLDWHVSI